MSRTVRIVDIVDGTAVDGPGLRTSIYTAGCAHCCPECHNRHTWPFDSGRDMTAQELLEQVERNGFNVTFSGGDPMYQAAALAPLAAEIRSKGYNVWCYTGFTFEELARMPEATEFMRHIDVLVDGPFIASRRRDGLHFRGSDNQRILDLPASLAAGHAVELARYAGM
ncbi:MAG: anaerobic ribonucleoside-triphosphate reductase activating protein [Muribaculaceae bacterium]|nr:anaerobic ribonucleoside-triphosphate reductase activating protein [Muribaculaceae bacterium]